MNILRLISQLIGIKTLRLTELDAKLIITAITNNSDCHSDLSPLIDDCRKLLRQLP